MAREDEMQRMPSWQRAGWSHIAGDSRHTWHWFNAKDDHALCGYHPDPLQLTVRQETSSITVHEGYVCARCKRRLSERSGGDGA